MSMLSDLIDDGIDSANVLGCVGTIIFWIVFLLVGAALITLLGVIFG